MCEVLSELREPPVVGRFYWVPVIENWRLIRVRDTWPVLGPVHTDMDIFPGFPWKHYHIDARFITARQEMHLSTYRDNWIATVGSLPLSHRPEVGDELPRGRPVLRKRKCRRTSYGYAFSERIEPTTLRNRLGDPAQPIRAKGGRLLCPHRKVDLSSFPPDENGIVVCPLHGLPVQCHGQQVGEPA